MPTPSADVQAEVRRLLEESGWDGTWQKGITPWDVGYMQPPLREVIESDRVNWPRTGKALVPGCGAGHDVRFIAESLGLQTIGADISSTAIEKAKATNGNAPGVSFELGDFFAIEDQFDLIYDYTFFVALPPTMRPDWGKQITKLVKPGGYLITLIFPIDPPQDHGPPYFVRPNHYEEVLHSADWEKLFQEVPKHSTEEHKDREVIAVWKRL